MREVGVVIWVVLLLVGVIGSMISTVRKQMQAQPQSQQRRERPRPAATIRLQAQPAAAPPAPPPAPSAPAARRKPPPQPVSEHPPPPVGQVRRRVRLFETRGELVRAVIAAEVLGKPRGLSDEYSPH